MMLKTSIFLLLITLAHNLFANDMPPKPLRIMVMESECIVFGDVIRVETRYTETKQKQTVAILAVQETLKGLVESDTIEIYFNSEYRCPAPAYYFENTTVLAFLNKRKTGFYTHAQAYGSKPMDVATFEVYKKRILEIQEIFLLEDHTEKSKKTIDWLIQCAANPATRWEGAYELSPKSNFMSYYHAKTSTFLTIYQLTENQLATIRELFFKIEKIDYTDFNLIAWIEQKNDAELNEFLIMHLRKISGDRMSSEKIMLMEKIADLNARDDLKQKVLEVKKMGIWKKENESTLSQLIMEFIEMI